METKEDIHNAEAWVCVVEDIICAAPYDVRAKVFDLLKMRNEATSKRTKLLETSGEFAANYLASIELAHWHSIMRLRSLAIQILARCICNNHSREDADKLLFSLHRYGQGSRRLADYLGYKSHENR